MQPTGGVSGILGPAWAYCLFQKCGIEANSDRKNFSRNVRWRTFGLPDLSLFRIYEINMRLASVIQVKMLIVHFEIWGPTFVFITAYWLYTECQHRVESESQKHYFLC